MAIKKDYLVVKKNVLNELRSNNMTLQELRFFSIYLSKINSKDVATRIVRFSIEEFQRIMEFGRLNIAQLKATTNSLLGKVVNVPLERGGYTAFQLFKECTVSRDNDEWYIEIDAHDKALPLMFEFQRDFFKYELWNALRLRSANQVRFYEVLKQYENLGERTLDIDELKELIGIEKQEYPRWNNLKAKVINVCQDALQEHTDIKFEYEPIKHGRGGKVSKIRFKIEKNKDYIDQLELAEFIELQPAGGIIEEEPPKNRFEERLDFLSGAVEHMYSHDDMVVIHDMTLKMGLYDDLEAYNYLKDKYHVMVAYINRGQYVKSRSAYLKGMIKNDLTDTMGTNEDSMYSRT